MWAVINGENEFVKYWIENYEDNTDISYELKSDVVTGSNRTALHWAIIEENAELTEIFIDLQWFDLFYMPTKKTPSPAKMLMKCKSFDMTKISKKYIPIDISLQ